jgi:hypothetical protein
MTKAELVERLRETRTELVRLEFYLRAALSDGLAEAVKRADAALAESEVGAAPLAERDHAFALLKKFVAMLEHDAACDCLVCYDIADIVAEAKALTASGEES